MIPLVSICIVSYNDENSIETAVKSAALQLHPAVEILVLDNNSKDNTREILHNLRDRLPGLRAAHLGTHGIRSETFRYHVLEAKENLGYAKGNNKLIAASQGEFVLLLNSDAGLDDQFLMHALPRFKQHARLSAIQGKLYRYDPETEEPVLDRETQKPIIDTTGLLVLKNRRILNRGQGEPDTDRYDTEKEIFGPDGAAPLYRRKALEDVKLCLGGSRNSPMPAAVARYEYLDEDFFMYKEDVDLAWRLRLAGWHTLYIPAAVAYHERGSGESAATSYSKIIAERRKLSRTAKFHAFKNQRFLQLKNELPGLLLHDFFHWAPKELGSWLYILLFERYTWNAAVELLRLFPKMLRKRRAIMAHRKADTQEMAKWFT